MKTSTRKTRQAAIRKALKSIGQEAAPFRRSKSKKVRAGKHALCNIELMKSFKYKN